jgi:betaine-aldehyde dehydrogenase
MIIAPGSLKDIKLNLPKQRGAFYGGRWHQPKNNRVTEQRNPGTGASLGHVADCGGDDIDAAVTVAKAAFREWKRVPPLERAKMLREIARVLRGSAAELAMIDAADCGNPLAEMIGDANVAAAQIEFFAGLVTEMKGHSIPMGPDRVNFSVREPLGVVGRIVPFNHPFMFIAGKIGAPLAAGNTVVMKPPEQAPLSSLRFSELIDGLLPPGVFNLVPGGPHAGAALASHPEIAKICLIGSVPTGKAVMRAAVDTLKRIVLELGGKNALIAYPDANPDVVATGLVNGMNFTWCGQSCGSTSRAFLHEKIHDEVVEKVKAKISYWKPGIPTDPGTTMGALISKPHYDRVVDYIKSANDEGARLVCGGKRPSDPALADGFFIEPTVFDGVKPSMRIFKEEIFGPVVGITKWTEESIMFEQVNSVEYGLTASIWTNDLTTAHRAAANVEAGYVWVNDVSKHFLGAPFGGYKQSGIGREECIEELMAFTQEKNININLAVPTQ